MIKLENIKAQNSIKKNAMARDNSKKKKDEDDS